MSMQAQKFVHLRLHTEFSIQEGMIRIPELMSTLVALKMPAVAITDMMNLFATVKFYQAALQRGIKPIIGCEVSYHRLEQPNVCYHLVLLCQNLQGYRNLTQLISKGYEQGQHQGRPVLALDWIFTHAEGLIALSAGVEGDVGQSLLQGKYEQAQLYAKQWQERLPGQYYLEIQRLGRHQEEQYNQSLVQIADELSIPLVATNSVCFLQAEDYEAHEARLCIHQGRVLNDQTRPKTHVQSQYLTTPAQMIKRFADLPQAIENTYEIAKRCNLVLTLGKSYLPNFPTPAQLSVEDYLTQQSRQGLEARVPYLSQRIPIADYHARLENELTVITTMGFSGYFLIVADFIQWAKEQGIPVGPGRGSGAGSLVAYALRITDLDPLEYDLLFERFLNPERVSMPDFDVDFCMVGRDRVIDYVARRYGRESVAQIITFGTMAAKAVVRDVGRVLNHPYNFVDKIAKLIPFELGMTLELALSQEPELFRRYQAEEDVKELLNLAKKLEGITRNAGKHAGGVVIAPSRLTDFTAVYCEEDSTQKVSQFDKDDVEAVGLVKFDFLGLRTLTIIDEAIKNIKKLAPLEQVDLTCIDLQDVATFALLQSGYTTAVFQLESRGMQELIKRLKPDCFEDIIALVALFRPGPLQSGMVDDFIDRKQGRAPIIYLHPKLETILKPTYGVILYQEQVMQIAQVLANYTLGAADLLRRAMGKKKPEEMAKQRSIFLAGAAENQIDAAIATQIFDLMEKFAGYGFNKSHSAAYALVSYQTAWLKSHYPAAFMAAVLSADMDNTDKVVHMLAEAKRMKLSILPPCIQRSSYRFYVEDEATIIYGLGAIKGIGEAAVELIVQERCAHGPYLSLDELCQRLDLRKINKRVLEALIKSGAMDQLAPHRALLWHHMDASMKLGAINWSNKQCGQQNLLDFMMEEDPPSPLPAVAPWLLLEKLQGEKDTLGWYLSGHPADEMVQEFSGLCLNMQKLAESKAKLVRFCGMIQDWRKMITKKGKTLVVLTLAQAKHQVDMLLFPDKLPAAMTQFAIGDLVLVEGEISYDTLRQQQRVIVQKILSYDDARQHYVKNIKIMLKPKQHHLLKELQAFFQVCAGLCPITVLLQTEEFQVQVNLPSDWRIAPTIKNLQVLSQILGEQSFQLCYQE